MRETPGSVIDLAPLLPRAPEPFDEEPPEPRRLRNLPIGLLGIGEATAGESVRQYGVGQVLFLYEDSRGCRRIFSAEQHDRVHIQSLFLCEEYRLPRLWPATKVWGRWDHDRAAEEFDRRSGPGRDLQTRAPGPADHGPRSRDGGLGS